VELTADTSSRLDAFLASKTSLSRSRVRRAIDLELVTVNGSVELKPAKKVKKGDIVEIDVDSLPVEGAQISPVNLSLEVLYEDAACMVICKPSGVSVHPGAGMPPDEVTVLHGIAWLMKERSLPFSTETSLVHRLDKDTTGCLLVAKTAAAHTALQSQFADRTVQKSYLALVSGVPDPPKAVIDAPIGRNLTERTKMSVLKTTVSREAKTSYEVLDQSAECALVRCDLHTGRTHQIRVHMAFIGQPVLGDATYGSSESSSVARKLGVETLLLHAWRLTFVSPDTGKHISVQCTVPASWAKTLSEAGISEPQ